MEEEPTRTSATAGVSACRFTANTAPAARSADSVHDRLRTAARLRE